nr:MAG TPA: hypothetical protein [Caudoviricetes sp.]
MFNINKGLFGLYNFEDTILEVAPEDSLIKGCVKGAAQGAINGTVVVGTAFIIAVNLLRFANRNQE